MKKLLAYLPAISPAVPLLFFLFFCLFYMNSIALIYDETAFVNIALGEIAKGMTYKKIFGIPLMMQPDQGVLKSYLYYPLFKLFGVSITTIRLPTILLSCLTLLVWFKLIKKTVSNNVALFFLMLLATDQFFIFASAIDYGPIVIQNFLIAITLYFYFQAFEKNPFRNLFIMSTALILGVLNKLNFIWFITAFLATIFLYHSQYLFNLFKSHTIRFSLLCLSFIVPMLFITIFLILPAIFNFPMGKMLHASLTNKMLFTSHLYLSSLNSSYTYLDMFHKKIAIPSMINCAEISCLIIWLFIAIFNIGANQAAQYNKPILFFLMLYLFETILIFFTPHTYAPNHIMILWPLPQLLFFLMSISITYKLFSSTALKAGLPIILTSMLIIFQFYVNYEYAVALKETEHFANVMWSPAIYDLSDYVNEHSTEYDHIISLDWGINNPIFSLAKNNINRMKFYEISGAMTDDPIYIQIAAMISPDYFSGSSQEIQEKIYNAFFNKKNNLVIFYTNNLLMHGVRNNFILFCEYYHLQMEPVSIIRDNAGFAIFSLYSVHA